MFKKKELSKDYIEYLASNEWKLKRIEAMQIHGNVCLKCGSSKRIHIHHKTYINFKNEYAKSELIPLCSKCHKKLHKLQRNQNVSVTEASFIFMNDLRYSKKTVKKFSKKKLSGIKKFSMDSPEKRYGFSISRLREKKCPRKKCKDIALKETDRGYTCVKCENYSISYEAYKEKIK